MSTEEFDKVLIEICREYNGEQLLSIPGIYEILSEHFNNDVIDFTETKKQMSEHFS